VTAAADARLGNRNASATTITRPPELSGTKISKIERSKQIEVEASTPLNSSGENTPLAHAINATALLC
jgi:hypothetical protein